MPGRLLGIGRTASPVRSSSVDSTSSGHGLKLPNAVKPNASTMEHLKRHSLAGMAGLHKDKKKERAGGSPSLKPTVPKNRLSINIESPPNVFHGKPQNSSGVLLSGILYVDVEDEEITLSESSMRLVCNIIPSRPVVKDCRDCIMKETELKKWTFLRETKTLKHGKHAFPFSHLVPGHLPASMASMLAQVQYKLIASAKTVKGDLLSFDRDIAFARAISVPPEKNSLRVFPPTDMQVHLSMVPVIHPIGRFPVSFRLSNINCAPNPKRPDLHTRWIIRKLTWKFEESESMISPACDKHASKVGGKGRGKEHSEMKVLERDDLFEGFKIDYSSGEIDCEFSIVLSNMGAKKALCDVDTGTGFTIKHTLVIELIIAEEWQSNSKSDKWGATGQARVLRAQFGLQVTERAGLGIAWDEEEPPLYEDMGQGPPPDYQHEFGLPPLTEQQRTELAARAREARATPAAAMPDSPPVYGVNSHMATWTGAPLEEITEDLTLEGRPQAASRSASERSQESIAVAESSSQAAQRGSIF